MKGFNDSIRVGGVQLSVHAFKCIDYRYSSLDNDMKGYTKTCLSFNDTLLGLENS